MIKATYSHINLAQAAVAPFRANCYMATLWWRIISTVAWIQLTCRNKRCINGINNISAAVATALNNNNGCMALEKYRKRLQLPYCQKSRSSLTINYIALVETTQTGTGNSLSLQAIVASACITYDYIVKTYRFQCFCWFLSLLLLLQVTFYCYCYYYCHYRYHYFDHFLYYFCYYFWY